jgi:putative ABC transport system permease protein
MLIWAGVWRKPIRTVLTVLSVAIAFLLFGALRGVTGGLDSVVNLMSANRLRVQSRAGFRDPLPLSFGSEIVRVPGVSNVGFVTVFDSYFQDPKNSVAAVAVGGELLNSLPPEFKIAEEVKIALSRTRTGAVVGRKLAEKYGWKIGDRIPLHSNIWVTHDGGTTWSFDIVGFYDVEGRHDLAQEFYFNYDYLDQERTVANGTVSMYLLQARNPAQTAAAIDQLFANSANPTVTRSDRDWVRAQLKQVGDINFMVNAIVGASLFTLLFLTANTMMRSVRERTPEIATLKALGFSDTHILGLIIAEALAVCLWGAVLGLAGARLVFLPVAALIPVTLPVSVVLAGLLIAACVAVTSALIPSWQAKRLSVVDALAGR